MRRLLRFSLASLALFACSSPTPSNNQVIDPDALVSGIDGTSNSSTDAGSTTGTDADQGTDAEQGTDADQGTDSGTTTGGACKTDADCTGGSPAACKILACKENQCVAVDAADGSTCDDGSACTDKDACKAGTCTGEAKSCDDQNACTTDACDPAKGCTNTPNSEACDDGDTCTDKDVCADGKCTGTAKTCDDGNPCTDDTCDKEKGCQTKATSGGACDDGDACTEGDKCQEGVCVPGGKKSCDDANSCTDDSCNPKSGCVNAASADGAGCTDGDACTAGDACKAGKCEGAATTCDDKNACTKDSCDKATGCLNVADDTASCNDDNSCTANDACKGGKCVGTGGNCDDKNPCTDDGCDAGGKCTYANNSDACDDGNPCTQADLCTAGTCKGGTELNCDDKNPCTTDSCDKASGACKNEFNTADCDDKSACTTGDVCGNGLCAGAPKKCDDGNVCTADSCDPTTGNCKSAPYADGTSCTDGSVCTQQDACKAGACVGQAITCDDQNPCTSDTCDKVNGCQVANTTAACDDGNPCTTGDACKDGKCAAGATPTSCDDKNACTTDLCDPKVEGGCVNSNNTAACSDSNACTTGDVCKNGACAGAAVTCDDNNVCTNDTCDPAKGCVYTPNTALCSDGSVCSLDDTCANGKCVGKSQMVCNDFNPCTTDTCDAKLGCQYKAVADKTACDDGNGCTTSDVCTAGKCAGAGKSCDDNNVCTTDSCANNVCKNVNNKNPCNDGNACTLTDACDGAGKCVGANPQKCTDGNPCTNDTCDPKSGGCVYPANTATCDDGKFCTVKDTCANGKCAGVANSCDDGNVCTNDACDGVAGKCVHTNNFAKCDDGSACTQLDLCSGGACKAGPKLVCNDNNPCTVDSCDKVKGCVYTLAGGTCSAVALPVNFAIDYNDTWFVGSSTSATVKWQTDATPAVPGRLTGAASLNFNNGVNFDDAGNQVKGAAYGKFLIDATKVTGAYLTMSFFSYADTEALNTVDNRTVEFSTDGFLTTALSVKLDNSKNQKTWYMETINLAALIGKSFQVRFVFDSADGVLNSGAGWFVDEVNFYAGPVVTVDPTKTYTDAFDNNVNGWQFSAPISNIGWAIDGTPNPPAALAGTSLNFNNGKDYAAGSAVAGAAYSPVLNFEGVAKGAAITLLFKEWVDVETPASDNFDTRWVEVSGDAFVTLPVKKQMLNTTAHMKGWQWRWVDLSAMYGKKVRLRFVFDSKDANFNNFAGWFIEDAQLDVRSAPVWADLITCANAGSWTISKTGTSGAANWAVDATGIKAHTPDCSLNFNALNKATAAYDFTCSTGATSGNVAGVARSPVIALPALPAGAKTLTLSYWYYVDAETISGFDTLRVSLKDGANVNNTLNTQLPDKAAALKVWKQATMDVTAQAGKKVVLEFLFDSGDCANNGGAGVAFDDVMIRADK